MKKSAHKHHHHHHHHKIHKTHKKKHTKNWFHRWFTQKGKGKMLPIIIVAVVVLLGAGGFYILSQKTGVSIPGMAPALNPNCELKDPELCKFMNNWANQRDYSVTSTSSFGGMNVESIMEISGTDKTHMVSKQNGKEVTNSINIGDTTYTLDYTDNKWWKVTLTPEKEETSPEKEMKDEFDIPESKDTTTYKFIAKEACGDRTCFKYELVDTSSTAESKQFLWFDDREYLIRKMRIEDNQNGAMEAVYTYGNINISAPSPVKEGSPADAAGAGRYNEEEAKKMMEQYQQQAPADTSNYDQEAPVDNSDSGY